MKRTIVLFFTILAVSLFFVACTKENETAKQEATKQNLQDSVLKNLIDAYQTEFTDIAEYKHFADDADIEGYKEAACLFRAVSKSESIVAANHLKVIQAMGGNVNPKIENFPVSTTKVNLKNAADDEAYEYTIMYPEYIDNAQDAHNMQAIRSLDYALNVEKGHSGLYNDALNNLPDLVNFTHSFWVCPVCGNTFEEHQSTPCPNCSTPSRRFVEIK